MIKKYWHVKTFLFFSLLPQIVVAGTFQPFVDVLTWRASETNTAWVTSISFPSGATDVIDRLNSYPTRAGVKAGLFYLSDNNLWDTKLYLTHYATDNTANVPASLHLVSSLFFSGSYFISGDLFFGASSNWQLAMNMLDLEISRHFKPTETLSISPKIGLKGGAIDQEIKVDWNADIYTATENVISDFTGIGPQIGLNAKWNFYTNLNLIADVSTAIMYGKWNMKDTYKRPASFVTTQTTITTSLNQAQLGSLMTDYYVGLEWVHQGISRISVRLGYEMQYWSNQLRIIAVQQLPAQGDLTLQGATCGISIDL